MNTLTRTIFETIEFPVFSVADIMNIESDANARYGLIKRAMKAGDIIQIRRVLYTLAPSLRKKNINLFGLSNLMYYPSYVSLLSALSNHGWIPERVHTVTCATSKNSSKFDTPLGGFTFNRIPQRMFFCATEVTGGGHVTWLQARPLKALADYVYVHRLTWNTVEPLLESLRIETDDLESLTAEDFDDLQGNYHTAPHVEDFLAGLRRDFKL